MALFPFVPNVPGVPALLRDVLRPVEDVILMVEDTLDFLFGFGGGPEWGVFLDGQQIVAADSVVSLEFREAWVISDYPLEEGAFENYDKVQTPFAVKVRFAGGGDVSSRADFLDSISSVMGDLELYDVVTPEKVYTSVNFERQDYRRTATSGAGLISVDVWFTQVNVTAQAAFSDTQAPSGAGQTNAGTVQPQATTTTDISIRLPARGLQ